MVGCRHLVVVGLLLAASGSAACAHRVRVTSNAVDAVVRVDGTPVGEVKDGAHFDEKWGLAHVYDVEVSAPHHLIARRQLKAHIVDAGAALPALGVAVGGCALAAGVAPLLDLLNLFSVGDREALGLGSSVAVLGCTGVSTLVIALGSQRLPDEIRVELEPGIGLDDQGLPPPPSLDPASASASP